MLYEVITLHRPGQHVVAERRSRLAFAGVRKQCLGRTRERNLDGIPLGDPQPESQPIVPPRYLPA